MRNNIYIPPQGLKKPVTTSRGSWCSAQFFRITDVQAWPVVNPASGVILSPLQLKAGAKLYLLYSSERDKLYTEEAQQADAGQYVDVTVTASIPGNFISNSLTIAAMLDERFGVIMLYRTGHQRLIGHPDNGAEFTYQYTEGTLQNNGRGYTVRFRYQHPLPPPYYLSALTISDATIGNGIGSIELGWGQGLPPNVSYGGPSSTGLPPPMGLGNNNVITSLTLVDRFKVGALDAPMVGGNSTYSNTLLQDADFIILADGKAIHQIDTDLTQRFAKKAYSNTTITINGGVTDGENIEIYKY